MRTHPTMFSDIPIPAGTRRPTGFLLGLAGVVLLATLSSGAPGEAAAPAVPGATYVGSTACKGCHEDQFKKLDATLHSRVLGERGRTQLQQQACESCHGPGSKHLEDQANPAYSIRFGPKSAQSVADRNAVCLQCHQKGKRLFWHGSQHEARDVTCTTCHSIKSPKSAKAQLTAVDQLTLCKQCHAVSVAQQANWSHMPVREGKIQCATCHNVHGTITEKLIPENSINENCYRCHTDKRGPFLWEHAPVRESCMNCHKPHGSNNIRLLRIREPRLCQQCHNESRHPSTAFAGGSNQDPTIDRRFLGRSCALCHNNIHGSNHPQGFAFTR
ncbi:MAG: putative deca-heme c-type cytochrome [candidate division NC10 bacterium]|nr:putative deca-heme c-type cytochrome [candidate division NC10 bacterium]